MIVPQEHPHEKITTIIVAAITLTVLIGVGGIIINEIAINTANFTIVDMKTVQIQESFFGLFNHQHTEYRIFYGNEPYQYVLTTKDAYSTFSIGDNFQGPILFEG
jgi:hypothetical protein